MSLLNICEALNQNYVRIIISTVLLLIYIILSDYFDIIKCIIGVQLPTWRNSTVSRERLQKRLGRGTISRADERLD